MNFETRLAKPEDVIKIAEITQEYEPQNLEDYINAFKDQVETNYNSNSCAFIFVTLINGEVVGHGKLFKFTQHRFKVDFPSPEGWYLNGIIVEPKFRRRGIAKDLLRFRKEFIQKRDGSTELYSIVAADNTVSIEYHLNQGFKEISRAPGYLNIKLNCGEGILFKI